MFSTEQMGSQAALFKILYQNDTLYQLDEKPYPVVGKALVEPEVIEEKVIQKATLPTIAITEKPVPAVTEVAKPIVNTPPMESFPTLNHKILILVEEPKHIELLAAESLFLDNILKAVKSSINNADIINASFLPRTDARNVLAERKTNYFITFGVPLIRLQLDLLLIPYMPKLVEGIWFLLTDPLVVIEADRDLKRKLWQALQKMFETPN